MNTTDPTVAVYLRNVRRQRRITREEEIELGGLSRAGCERSRERLVTANLGFVVSIAKEYRNRGIAFEDWVEDVYDPKALKAAFHTNRAGDALLSLLRRE